MLGQTRHGRNLRPNSDSVGTMPKRVIGAEGSPSEAELRATRSRRGVLILRALHSPEGLTKYGYTKGMLKIDAMRFWNDARTLGFVKLGTNARGTNLFGFRSEPCE